LIAMRLVRSPAFTDFASGDGQDIGRIAAIA
jgi:hypothetical protein